MNLIVLFAPTSPLEISGVTVGIVSPSANAINGIKVVNIIDTNIVIIIFFVLSINFDILSPPII